jgi:uncharacterized phage protein gp47/JayE
MSIKYNDIAKDIKLKFKEEFPQSNPFITNSFLGVLLNTISYGIYQIYLKMDWLIKQVFANTANKEHLILQAQNRIELLPPASSSGKIIISGSDGKNLSAGSILKNGDIEYSVRDNIQISTVTLDNTNIESLNTDETLAILKFKNTHNLVTGMELNIYNSIFSAFNGAWGITVISDIEIRFNIKDPNTLSEPISTTPNFKVNRGIGYIDSVKIGTINNIPAYTQLDTTNPNIDLVFTDSNSITGGRDEETDEAYRDRFLDFLRRPQAYFNARFVEQFILNKFSKVTRCKIDDNIPITNLVQIYVVDDNASNLEVDSTTISMIRYKIDKIKPINLNSSNLTIQNPNQIDVNITISNLNPSASTFKELVKNDIEEYIKQLDVGKDINISLLEGYIYNIKDYQNGYRVKSFNINPTTNISIPQGYIAIPKIEVS